MTHPPMNGPSGISAAACTHEWKNSDEGRRSPPMNHRPPMTPPQSNQPFSQPLEHLTGGSLHVKGKAFAPWTGGILLVNDRRSIRPCDRSFMSSYDIFGG